MVEQGRGPVIDVVSEIALKADKLEVESRRFRRLHQAFTVLTILLGVAAPAIVTYSPPPDIEVRWKLFAICATAFAGASATLRTVLRFGERYSNSALTAITLRELAARLEAQARKVALEVKPEYLEQQLLEYAAWGREQMFVVVRGYVEKDVAAVSKERIEISAAPEPPPESRLPATPPASVTSAARASLRQ